MSIRNRLMFVTALSAAAVSFFTLEEQGHAATATDLSAQRVTVDPNALKKPKALPAQRAAPHVQAPARVAPRQAPVRVVPAPRINRQAAPPPVRGQRIIGAPRNVGPRAAPVAAPLTAAPRIIVVPRQGNRAFTPRGANSNVVRAARIRSAPLRGIGRTSIQGRNYSVWRSNYRVRRGNGWRTFVALGALGTIAVGASQYYPYAYVQAPAPYCDGRTEDGCQLVFEDVETVEGDVIGQCVAYCPWQ